MINVFTLLEKPGMNGFTRYLLIETEVASDQHGKRIYHGDPYRTSKDFGNK